MSLGFKRLIMHGNMQTFLWLVGYWNVWILIGKYSLLSKLDLSSQCIALNLYVHISNSSLRSNLLGNKYDSTVCSTLLQCSVTIFAVSGSFIVLEL